MQTLKELRKKIKEIRKTDRGNALFKLSIWFLFLIGVFIFVNIFKQPTTENQNPNYEEIKKPEYFESLSKIFETTKIRNYKFTINYENNETKILYHGEHENNITTGYRETTEQILKYKVINNETYQILLEEEILITDLYPTISERYFNVNNIVDIIKNLDSIPFHEEKNRYYTYSLEDCTIKIKINYTEIETIEITGEDYQINFVLETK